MDCRYCADDLTAFMDGELDSTRAGEINAHLEACPFCAEEYQSLKASALFVEAHAIPLEPKAESWHALESRLSLPEEEQPRYGLLDFFVRFRALSAATVLAMAALSIGFWGYLRYRQDQRDLERYMNAYIEVRERQDQIQRRQQSAPVALDTQSGKDQYSDYRDNPFATYESTSFENPFQAEDQ